MLPFLLRRVATGLEKAVRGNKEQVGAVPARLGRMTGSAADSGADPGSPWKGSVPVEEGWSGRRESNPYHQLGRLRSYHYTTPALRQSYGKAPGASRRGGSGSRRPVRTAPQRPPGPAARGGGGCLRRGYFRNPERGQPGPAGRIQARRPASAAAVTGASVSPRCPWPVASVARPPGPPLRSTGTVCGTEGRKPIQHRSGGGRPGK